jgi:hypothetical protein
VGVQNNPTVTLSNILALPQAQIKGYMAKRKVRTKEQPTTLTPKALEE